MATIWTDLFTGTATPEVIALAGRVLLVLVGLSLVPAATGRWAPRWCHLIVAYAVIAAWVVWGVVCIAFQWDFHQPLLAQGWSLKRIGAEYVNELGYFGMGTGGMIFALIAAWQLLTGRGVDLDPEQPDESGER